MPDNSDEYDFSDIINEEEKDKEKEKPLWEQLRDARIKNIIESGGLSDTNEEVYKINDNL